MKLATLLATLGLLMLLASLGLAASGWPPSPATGGGVVAAAWFGVSFLLVSVAYARNHPGLFGKASDGGVRWPRRVIILPYLVSVWSIWWLRTRLTYERCSDQVFPNVWVGRWPLPEELPSPETFVVDFTSELQAHRAIRRGRYAAIPTLDGAPPDPNDLRKVLEMLDGHAGPILFHCAFGHGRSAFGAVAWLMRQGAFADSDQALVALRRKRPGISLGRAQRRALRAARWTDS